jgi:hypothetical protein
LLSDVLHVGEHVIGEESHPKRRDLWQVTSCRDKNRVLAGSSKMHQKRVTFGRVQEFWWGASRTHRKRTFVADSPDSGLVYPHKVGLPSHICNGNFGEVCLEAVTQVALVGLEALHEGFMTRGHGAAQPS